MSIRNGVCVRFGARGFGFLMDQASQEQFFVHVADVEGRRELRTGDKVTFEVDPTGGKNGTPRAIQVNPVASPRRVEGAQS